MRNFVVAEQCESLLFGPYLVYAAPKGERVCEIQNAGHYTLDEAMLEAKRLNELGSGHYRAMRDCTVKEV